MKDSDFRGGQVKPAERERRVREFRRWCREHGERITVQRSIILETVLDLDNHPSADQIYGAVEMRLPGIARTTVYRALEHLSRAGLITKACHPGRSTRFDPRTEVHHHLVCLHCNDVTDFEDEGLNGFDLPDTSQFGFEVEDYRIQLRGICKRCQNMGTKEESTWEKKYSSCSSARVFWPRRES